MTTKGMKGQNKLIVIASETTYNYKPVVFNICTVITIGLNIYKNDKMLDVTLHIV